MSHVSSLLWVGYSQPKKVHMTAPKRWGTPGCMRLQQGCAEVKPPELAFQLPHIDTAAGFSGPHPYSESKKSDDGQMLVTEWVARA